MRANLILVGFMGSGKSAIGRLAAHALRFQFLDTDAVVIERARMEIAEIFEKKGEPHFRDMETRAIESLAGLARYVVATGGGAVLREENRALLRSLGLVVLLTAREDILLERVSRTAKRPLLQTDDPRGTVRKLLAERQPAYEATAHWTLDTSDLTHEEATAAVVAKAREAFGWRA